MTKNDDLIRGSSNVFADFGDADAEVNQLKARIAAEVIRTLNKRKLTVRAAAKLADCDAADIQRIRNADLARFTLDRLIRYATRLGCRVEMKVDGARREVGLHKPSIPCYPQIMNKPALADIFERAKIWPEEDQDMLVAYAHDIEALRTGVCIMSDEERAEVLEGLAEADRREFATDEEFEALRKRFAAGEKSVAS